MNDHTRRIMFSSSNDEYESPPELFKKLHEVFNFTIDLAAAEHNALLPRHYSLEDNALSQDWKGETGFCNPPYSNIKDFVWKAQYERLRSSQTELVYLIPARTETRYWFDHIWNHTDMICFIQGRLKFTNKAKENGDKPSSAPFPSALIFYGNLTDENVRVFRKFGHVITRY